MANIETMNPAAVEAAAGKKGVRAKGMSAGADFGSMLDAVGAMGPTAMTAGQLYGSPNSAAVLGAAFSGVSATSATMGGGYYGGAMGGMSGGTPYLAAGMGYKATGIGGLNSPAIPGADGMSQMDMINTMNQNNLGLLELQAVMQNNMQGWNTKSNILSADHRARMAMIEKFAARG